MKTFFCLLVICLLCGETHAAILRLTSTQAAAGAISASAGDTVTVQVSIDAEGKQIRGIEVFITLPDSVFEVIDADTTQLGIQPFQRGGFINGSVIFNRLSSDSGLDPSGNRLDYGEIRQIGSNSGTGTIVTFRLVALKSADDFSIRIVRQFPLRETKYLLAGQDAAAFFRQLGSLQGAVVGFPIASLPAIRVPVGGQDNALDLDDYIDHPDFADTDITWTAQGFDATLITVSIDAFTHIVTFRSISDLVGQTSGIFTATDPNAQTGVAAVTVTVTSGPKILLPNELSFLKDTSLQLDLSQYVEDADNALLDLLWDISGGNHISSQHSGQTLLFTAPSGWTGVEIFTFTVTDPEGAQDQKSVAVSVTSDNHSKSAPTDRPSILPQGS